MITAAKQDALNIFFRSHPLVPPSGPHGAYFFLPFFLRRPLRPSGSPFSRMDESMGSLICTAHIYVAELRAHALSLLHQFSRHFRVFRDDVVFLADIRIQIKQQQLLQRSIRLAGGRFFRPIRLIGRGPRP